MNILNRVLETVTNGTVSISFAPEDNSELCSDQSSLNLYETSEQPYKVSRREGEVGTSHWQLPESIQKALGASFLLECHKKKKIASGTFKYAKQLTCVDKDFKPNGLKAVRLTFKKKKKGASEEDYQKRIKCCQVFFDTFRNCSNIDNCWYIEWKSKKTGKMKYGFLARYYDFDLFDWLSKYGSKAPLANRIATMIKVARSVQTLHNFGESGWVHRDLKLENLLVSLNDDRSVKDIVLSDPDFAISLSEATHDDRSRFCGTFDYVAPEMLSSASDFTDASLKNRDIYSLGIIFNMLLKGSTILPIGFPTTDNDEDFLMALRKLGSQQTRPLGPKDKKSLEHLIWEMYETRRLHCNERPKIDVVVKRLEDIQDVFNKQIGDDSRTT